MSERSRRDYLRTVLSGAAAGVLAGCAQLPANPLGGDDRTGTYLDWLPAPERMHRDPYEVRLLGVRAVREHRSEIHPATRRLAARRWLPYDPTVRDALGTPADVVGLSAGTRVLRGVTDDDPAGTLRDLGYGNAETRGDAVVLTWSERRSDLGYAPGVVAVSGSDVVVTTDERDRDDVVAVVDAYRGSARRLHEEVTGVETVGTTVGARTYTTLDPTPDHEELAGLVAIASSWDVEDGTARLLMALQFEDDADAEVADVNGAVGWQWLQECRDVSVTRDGATVELTAVIDAGRFDFQLPGRPGADGLPNAEFDVEYYLGSMEIRHAGAQPVPAAELEVALYTNLRLDSVPVERQLTETQFDDRFDTVAPGDDISVEPDQDGDVRVEWVHPGTGTRVALGSHWFDA